MLEEEEGPSAAFVEQVNKNVIEWLYKHIKGFDRSVAEYKFMNTSSERLSRIRRLQVRKGEKPFSDLFAFIVVYKGTDMKQRRTITIIIGTVILCLFLLMAFHMRQTKVVCVGDSITYGSGAGRYRKTKSYPAILQEKLGSRYRVRNYGLRGRTLLDYGNFPYKGRNPRI